MTVPDLPLSHDFKRLPPWLRRSPGTMADARPVKKLLRDGGLHTVCEEARCPNLGECFSRRRATFLILGDRCTRGCGFCSVEGGLPLPPDPGEPRRVAEAAEAMGARYVVITSVTRDDLADGGASHFAETVREVGKRLAGAEVEVLTPDFGGSREAVRTVCAARPAVYNHNVETVPSLYGRVRPQASYERSLALLRQVKELAPRITTKSGLMLGFGEVREEVLAVLRDLKGAGCDLVTVGQYMRPTRRGLPVVEYVPPAVFDEIGAAAREMGFRGVYSAPLVRSSFNAEEQNSSIERG